MNKEYVLRFVALGACLALFIGIAPAAAQVDGTLVDLVRIKDGVRSKRISSYDQTGGNRDRFENVVTGEEKRTLTPQAMWMFHCPSKAGTHCT